MNSEKDQGEYVNAAVPGVEVTPLTRRSHRFCGCCCDTRRATIVVNIISLVFTCIFLLGVGTFTSDSFASSFDDDNVKKEMEVFADNAWVTYLSLGASFVFYSLGIYGAVKYNTVMVLVAAAWYCLQVVFSIWSLDITGAILPCLFVYPHIVFYNEVKQGIMSEANYPNEQYSCCCV